MKPRKAREIEAALLQKGFLKRTSHHNLFYLCIDGKITGVHTFMSHGVREYGNPLLEKMKNQMHLSAKELELFIRCPLTFENYIALLKEQGIVKNDKN
ncbi:MAG: hypothetical protein A4E35_00604 [Methanoregula sp. PtaU1.Bin051]|nr:MAG: hypothetical protein A4E35_00604 [Methanoregula sp. PtaU1.Bin051]